MAIYNPSMEEIVAIPSKKKEELLIIIITTYLLRCLMRV
jgi:hypothetical protein